MPRSSMATLISRTRDLIGDPAGASAVWTDDQIQGYLDQYREDVIELDLDAVPFHAPGGALSYKQFFANRGDWEDDDVLTDVTFTTVTPDSKDTRVGVWNFNTGRTNAILYLTGKSYDLYRAAAELCEAWAAKVKLDFDFETDGQKFSRAQKAEALLELAKTYRRKRRVGKGKLIRTDERA